MKDLILKYVLQNAVRYDGKANAGAIIGRVIQEQPELKFKTKEVSKEILDIVNSVNKMNLEEQRAKLELIAPQLLEEKPKEQEEGLKALEGAVNGKVVTRLAPEPSKYNHIGHALIFLIQYMYAQKYNGKCLLRFDDTNPEKSTIEYYNAMKDDLTWLGIKWEKEITASDDIPTLYQYAEKLIKQDYAFVCSCNQDEMKRLRGAMQECKCRKNKIQDNLKEWELMLTRKYKESERTLRLRGDMQSNNGVMRDPVLFRISYAEHFIQKNKYCVWPMYDFENPIEDSLNGVTHIIRTNEFELRLELHSHLQKILNLKSPIVKEIGRYQIFGAETHGRVIREMIENNKINGWDDPRLVTIKALRRRGFVPEMFTELAKTVGLSKSSGHIDFTVLAAINRKILDSSADRYFLIKEPILIEIEGAPDFEVELNLHPDYPERGKRFFMTSKEFYLSKDDVKKFEEGKMYRLMDCLNFLVEKNKFRFVSQEYEKFKNANNKGSIIHYLPAKDLPKFELLMPDGNIAKGFCELGVEKLNTGAVIQAERLGFVRLDSIDIENNIYKFWYSHK